MHNNISHNNYGYKPVIREIKRCDILMLDVQDAQKFYKASMNQALVNGQLEHAWTYLEDGKVKACFGILVLWSGRAMVWALIGGVSKWVTFHRVVNRLMLQHVDKFDIIRLEMTTEVGFDESERWAQMLGFECESYMTNYAPDGKDHKMWVRLWQQHYL